MMTIALCNSRAWEFVAALMLGMGIALKPGESMMSDDSNNSRNSLGDHPGELSRNATSDGAKSIGFSNYFA